MHLLFLGPVKLRSVPAQESVANKTAVLNPILRVSTCLYVVDMEDTGKGTQGITCWVSALPLNYPQLYPTSNVVVCLFVCMSIGDHLDC